jgi:hypothetical protein
MIKYDLEEFEADGDEKAALEYCLSQQIWWSDRAHEFPRLLAASRQHSLLPILKRVNFKSSWDHMEYWGQFTSIIIAFSAAIPAFNFITAESKKDISSLQQVISDIRDSMDKAVIPGEKTWSFSKINDANPEDPPPKSDAEASDEDEPLPTFDDIEGDDSEAIVLPQTPRRS